MKNIALMLATMLSAVPLISDARADSMRCGTKLIEIGDIKAEVIEKCGQPNATDSYCRNEYVQDRFGYLPVCHNIDLWTYNLGAGTFLMNVEFEEGRISSISHGDRVSE